MKQDINMETENPSQVANKILTEYFEGKSYGFIKASCDYILDMLELICILPTSSED